jgi:AhpD family alkylhydroperoxidase
MNRNPASCKSEIVTTSTRGNTMSEFYDKTEDRKYTSVYKKETPDILAAFAAFDSAVFAAEGRSIPLKYRELIALSVGITTQCVYCIDAHGQNAVKAGATEAELAEAAWVATAIRAGGGFAHGRLAFKLSGANERDVAPTDAHDHEPSAAHSH